VGEVSRKVGRKTMKEIRLEERSRGFYECLEIFEEIWRNKGQENMRRGLPANQAFLTPACSGLWEGIEKAQKVGGKIDRDHKTIMFPRVYGNEFPFPNKEEEGG